MTRPDWWKPVPEEARPKTPEPDWAIPPNDLPETQNNWANAIANAYKDQEENKLIHKTGDMGYFIKCLKIGNGSNASFWKDHWCGDGSRLMDLFPRLYALESSKVFPQSMTEWHCMDGIGAIRLGLIDSLGLAKHQVSSNLKPSQRTYKPYRLTTSPLASTITGTLGFREKVNHCVWRASLDRLPSRANLAIRGLEKSVELVELVSS
ncbi:hypothetical protein Tco_0144575 [Tanacetum coccineum]